MKVLSLFDGMACGMLAMQGAGIEVERYVAYEIDKYAVQTSSHNFPMIEHRGDVFGADFTEFADFDFLVGGSPCTYWSIAQKNNRETEASGMGWELFCQYVRALHEAKPKFFVYENNKSMSKAIRASIDEAFGFEAIGINSALVSAQNRQRLYWVGKRNDDGTYSKVDVKQPEDLGILLKDILESGVADREKARCVIGSAGRTTTREYFKKPQGTMCAEPVNITADGKANCLRATCYKDGIRNMVGNTIDRKTCVAEPVGVGYRNRREGDGKLYRRFETHNEEKSNALTTVQTDSMVAEPVACRCRGRIDKDGNGYAKYECREDGRANTLDTNTTNGAMVAVPVRVGESATVEKAIPDIVNKIGYLPEMFNAYNRAKISDKTPTLSTGSMVTSSCAVNRLECISGYAVPCKWDESGKPTGAISAADGKTYPVYEVKDGQITIKGKTYPIKLADGFYIIRKLTVRECMRLQTVPEWYEFPVSDTQAYKMLGNGWTVDVITHLLKACIKEDS